MDAGGRVQELLDSHGHSYAKAEEITGVSRETIRRICLGHKPPKLHKYIRQIAKAYGLDELSLLEGASPKAEFEWNIRRATAGQRLDWLLMTPAQRLKMTLRFLQVKYPSTVAVSVLASAWGKTQIEVCSLLEKWITSPPDRQTAHNLAGAIHGLTGIPMSWFSKGRLADTWTAPINYLPTLAPLVRMNLEASTAEGLAALSRTAGLTPVTSVQPRRLPTATEPRESA